VPSVEASSDDSAQGAFGRIATVAVFLALIAAVIAGATIWLLLTAPMTMALAVESGEVTPLVRQLADILYQALMGILGYL
jgi:hypothetical protein